MKRLLSSQNISGGDEFYMLSSILDPKSIYYNDNYVNVGEIQKNQLSCKAQKNLLDCGLKEDFDVIYKISGMKNTIGESNKQDKSFKEFLENLQTDCPEFIKISPEEIKKIRITRAKLIEKAKRTDKEILDYILKDIKDLINVINKSQNIILNSVREHILTNVTVDFAFQSTKDAEGNIDSKVIIFIDYLNNIHALQEINKLFKENLGEDNYTIVVGKTEISNTDKILRESGLNTTVNDILKLRKVDNGYLFFEASLCRDGYLYHDGIFVENNFFEKDWDSIFPKEKEILEDILVYFCEMYKDTTWREAYEDYIYKYLLL